MYYLIEYSTANGKLLAITHGKGEDGRSAVYAVLSDTTTYNYKKDDEIVLFEHGRFKILETVNSIYDFKEDWAIQVL